MTDIAMPEPHALLRVDRLQLSYGSSSVLRGVDLRLQRGELMGLIGPNGSGKTSLIRALVGLVPYSAGEIRVAGVALADDLLRARAAIGYAPDPTRLPGTLSGRQALGVVAAARGLASLPTDVSVLAERLGASRWLDHRIDSLSLGTRQKMAILMALLGRPPLLILDEVMNGLDPISSHELKLELIERCEREGCAVLLATHGLEIAPTLLTAAVLLADGAIRHRWTRSELLQWRHGDPGAFERAVVEALRRDPD